jgi:pimeloyl-ACP methyl ester carboxylesterase
VGARRKGRSPAALPLPRQSEAWGAHAATASVRDLLGAIGIDRATLVGRSLGGRVAMQSFYQLP